MLISLHHRFLFIHVPKVAGTSFTAALEPMLYRPSRILLNKLLTKIATGGLLKADDLMSCKETYAAAEAFAGSYEVRVKRVWGRPVGGKAMLTVKA